jgi:hypothetical protein
MEEGEDTHIAGCRRLMLHFLHSNVLSVVPFRFPDLSKETFSDLVSQCDLQNNVRTGMVTSLHSLCLSVSLSIFLSL